MRFLHLADLHIGKRVNEMSMLEDQRSVLSQVLDIAQTQRVDAVLIAGDVYDKAVPSAEAVQVFDVFLTALIAMSLPVFLISGNHDSPERLAFGAGFMDQKMHLSPVFDGSIRKVTLSDEYGEIHVYLLPFLKPAHVRAEYPEAEIHDYTDAIRVVLSHAGVEPDCRNLLVAHQFVTGAVCCESEELSVGGLDQVDAGVFADFDYVALGHLHGAQRVTRDTVRYAGTPLKYSFSEANHKKSVTIVELREKGTVSLETVLLQPLHDLREIRGSYDELTARSFYAGTAVEDYLHLTLTDEEDIPDAIGKLRSIYPNLMRLDYDNCRTRQDRVIEGAQRMERKSPLALFGEFYEQQNNREMSAEQTAFVSGLIETLWEEPV